MLPIVEQRALNVQTEAINVQHSCVRVIGIGLSRTGTTSLKKALEILGFGPCHHMYELFLHPNQTVEFLRAYDGEKIDFQTLLKGYGSTIDLPTVQFYQELQEVFPHAKLILSVRDSNEKWFESYENTIGRMLQDRMYTYLVLSLRFLRLQNRLARKAIAKWIRDYGEIDASMHDRHNQRMIDEHKGKNLLVFNVKEGWKPLCEFLGVDEPKDIPFPNINDSKEFQSNIRHAKFLGLAGWSGISIVIGFSIYIIKKKL